jgi:hypothetical protein
MCHWLLKMGTIRNSVTAFLLYILAVILRVIHSRGMSLHVVISLFGISGTRRVL